MTDITAEGANKSAKPGVDARVFALPPGVDFPRAVADGLRARMAGQPPEALARVTVFVNTARMQRRLRACLAEGPALLMPRIRLVADIGRTAPLPGVPPAIPALRRRLELAQLVAGLIDRAPDLAPRRAIFALADSLARLLDEMQDEGVGPEALTALDLANQSEHWQRSRAFLEIAARFAGAADLVARDPDREPDTAPDPGTRQRLAIAALAERWRAAPPADPVIVAGSTGSRGSTAALMLAVARLPLGAVVLPGFDATMPAPVWDALDDAMTAEDHPQFRFHRLLSALGLTPDTLRPWHDTPPPDPARNRLVSLSLRPAPVTDQWLADGPALGPVGAATARLTLIEAPTPRAEALAIALRLRAAAEAGVSAALITPDRVLARQVTAALDRWGIVPDDSAGRPLALSAPGRFLRHVAAFRHRRPTVEALLVLLKHPLTHSAGDRGGHLRHARDLELVLRRHGPAFPDAAALRHWAARHPSEGRKEWAAWLADVLDRGGRAGDAPLADHLAAHVALAEDLATGPGQATANGGPGPRGGALWARAAGEAARAAVTLLATEAAHGGILSAVDYDVLFTDLVQREEVREPVTAHPGIAILGTLEARVQAARLVILGGLNDGIWPPLPAPDPWLNRRMRFDAGLLLPERAIGLSAHDYQQAMGADEVVIARSLRDAEAETVPSRWINRLTNLLDGLGAQGGPAALADMRARGQVWLGRAAALERAPSVSPAQRPAPRPPVAARPRELPVTAIRTLIRDPYAVYARRILRLRPLDPLRPAPDALLRGSVLHRILEEFVRSADDDDPAGHDRAAARGRLLAIADRVMAEDIPWPATRALWRARLDRVADWFLAQEAARPGTPVLIEKEGAVTMAAPPFTLTAKPDRIDRMPDGRLHILDYKTGAPPSPDQQKHFDKQLLLEAAMAERGGFAALGPSQVARISYVGVGGAPKLVTTEMDKDQTDAVWAELAALIAAYDTRAQGYTARRAVFEERTRGDYDHLARFGEWEMSDPSAPEDVG